MAVSTDAIYSSAGVIGWSGVITAAANDYTCISSLNQEVFGSNAANGGYLQRLRFKALGTNVATVARIFMNNGMSNQSVIGASGTPTGVAGTAAGGTVGSVTLYCKTVAIGQGGDLGTVSAESTGVAVTGPTGHCTWTNATPVTTFYQSGVRYYSGRTSNQQSEYFFAPNSTVTAQMSGTTTMTVTAITTAPNRSIGPALTLGTVFASGPTAGDYIVNQLTSSEADGSMGRTGTYQMNIARTFGPGAAVTNKDIYVQLTPAYSMIASYDGQFPNYNSVLIGEISLPATTISAVVATPDIDYIMNMALPPGYDVYVGLGTAVAAGWYVSSYGGSYQAV